MQTYSPKMLEAFEKEYGNLADFNGTKQEYFKLVKAFSHGWRAGQSFQQSVQRTAIAACNCPAFRPQPNCPIRGGGATRRR